MKQFVIKYVHIIAVLINAIKSASWLFAPLFSPRDLAQSLHIFCIYLERDTRIELVTKPWQGFEIPLHQSRIILNIDFDWPNIDQAHWA